MNDSDSFSMFDLFQNKLKQNANLIPENLRTQRIEAESFPNLFQIVQTIRSSARLLKIEPITQLMLAWEQVLIRLQNGLVLSSTDQTILMDSWYTLQTITEIADEDLPSWLEPFAVQTQAWITHLEQIGSQAESIPTPTPPPKVEPSPALPQDTTPASFSMLDLFREEVHSHHQRLSQGLIALEQDPANPQKIEPLMRAAHSIKGAARIMNVERAVQLAHVLEDALVSAQKGAIQIVSTDIDLFLQATDVLGSLSELTETTTDWGAEQANQIESLKEQLQGVAQGKRLAVAKPMARVVIQATEPVSPTSVTVASESVTKVEPVADTAEAVVRVTAQSLNRLMGLAGESLVQARWLNPFSTSLMLLKKQQDQLANQLATLEQVLRESNLTESILSQIGDARRTTSECRQNLLDRIGEFEDHASRAEDLNTRLYREVIVSRMRPFADGTHALPRMVRDMARSLGKQVRIVILGETTEVDRDILEKLDAPLTHMIRNAIDHGIEQPEERAKAGKPEQGTIRLEARHRAGMLAITVQDDGRGVDLEKLRRKIVEKGLTTKDLAQIMTEKELLEFLFLPGFSTAKQLTEYSGRGVGLDVVQELVRKVGGSVHITTVLGRGTTFHLQLPLTLSVVRAVLVEIAGEPYAFPHNRIDRLIRISPTEVHSIEHRQFTMIDGQNVGLVLASQILELPIQPINTDLSVILLSDHTGTYGMIVDHFEGEQDLVVRPLDARLGKVPNVSAAAILDDGSPVLIMDVEDLIRSMDQYIHTGSLRRYEMAQNQLRNQKRVLIAEDSVTVRELERQLLQKMGFHVTATVDGADAWNAAQTESFDLIVTDIDMPRMTGWELIAAIRSTTHLRSTPIIVVSYKDRDEDRQRGIQLGANLYLTKNSFHDNTFQKAAYELTGLETR